MLIPRIIYQSFFSSDKKHFDLIVQYFEQNGKGVFYKTKGFHYNNVLREVNELKKLCLRYKGFLILDDVKLAASVRADGVIVDLTDDNQMNSLDVLDANVMTGTYGRNVQGIVDICDLGMADIVVLDQGVSRTTQSKAQRIFEMKQTMMDIRIFGYDIPIFGFGNVDEKSAEALLREGCYGIGFSDIRELKGITRALSRYPLR